MATLQEYSAPNAQTAIRPTEVGEQAISRAATMGERRAAVVGDMYASSIGRVGRAVGEGVADVGKLVDDHMYHAEATTQIAARIAQDNAYQQSSNEFAKTPEAQEPGAMQKFYEDNYVPSLQKWQDGFHTERGQDLGQQLATRSMEHMQNLATVQTGEIASAKQIEGFQTAVTQASDAVSHDPSSLPLMTAHLKDMVELAKRAPGMTLEQANRLGEELPKLIGHVAQSSFYATLARNSSAALADLRGGKYDGYVGLDIGEMTNAAQQRVKQDQELALSASVRTMELKQMQERKVSQDAATGVLRNSMTTLPDGTIGLDPNKFTANFKANVDHMQHTDIEELLTRGHTNMNEAIKPFDQPEVLTKIQGLALSGDPSTDRVIAEARASKTMTPETAAQWEAVIHSPFMESAKDPLIHNMLEQNFKGMGAVIAGPTFGVLGQINKPGDTVLVNHAVAEIMSQLAPLTREQLVTAMDPASPTSPFNYQNLAKYVKLRATYEQQYGGIDTTPGPAMSAPTRPSIQLGVPK